MTSGKVIENPFSGERIEIRTTGAETSGELLVFDLSLPPGASVPAGHTHPVQEERFTVLSGEMRFRLGLRTVTVHPDETLVVPSKTAHWFSNPGDTPAKVRVEVRPALRTEELFEAAGTLGRSRNVLGLNLPRLTDLALFLKTFDREVCIPFAPRILVSPLIGLFARLSRRRFIR